MLALAIIQEIQVIRIDILNDLDSGRAIVEGTMEIVIMELVRDKATNQITIVIMELVKDKATDQIIIVMIELEDIIHMKVEDKMTVIIVIG